MAPLRITSRQNPRVKGALQLRQHKWRARRGELLIDGIREIGRALDAGIAITQAFVCEELCRTPASQTLVSRLSDTAPELFQLTPDVFAQLTFGDRAEGVVVVARAPDWGWGHSDQLQLPACPLVAVVERVEKPGNLGAILRSADGAGIDLVLVVDACTDLAHANTIRASLGTVFTQTVREATSQQALTWLRDEQIQICAARPDAERLYFDVDYRHATAIVLGSETAGLSDAWQNPDVTPIRLPMGGAADSLNVSATGAVLFYEAVRQRRHG